MKGCADDATQRARGRAEARFQAEASRSSFKYLTGYAGLQMLYLVGYFLAAYFHKLNYVPLVADSCMLVLHISVLGLEVLQGRRSGRCTNILLGCTLVVDAALFALADPVVESEANQVLRVGDIFAFFGGVPSLDGPSLPHPYKSNCVFQFHCLYMSLFVLTFHQALFIMPICLSLYGSLVITCYRSHYARSGLIGRDSSTDIEDIGVEFTMLFLTLVFAVWAKRILEQSQRPLFLATEHQKSRVIEEKVKRCQVEFKLSDLEDSIRAAKAQAFDKERVDGCPYAVMPLDGASLRSATSAPAAVLARRHGSNDGAGEACGKADSGGGDCLPPHAYVWVEHQAMPQPLASVRPGQRVLCYDSLLRGLKYNDVLNVDTLQEVSEAPKWVTVCLTDGTQLEMTSDHPVPCYSMGPRMPGEGDTGTGSKCVKAEDLQAGHDSVMVLKTVPVPVSSIKLCEGSPATTGRAGDATVAPAESRVALRVQHPDRHTVFVAQGAVLQRSMGVGSADLSPSCVGFRVKRTFVDVFSGPDQESGRRTASAPPAMQEAVGTRTYTTGAGAGEGGAQGANCSEGLDRQPDPGNPGLASPDLEETSAATSLEASLCSAPVIPGHSGGAFQLLLRRLVTGSRASATGSSPDPSSSCSVGGGSAGGASEPSINVVGSSSNDNEHAQDAGGSSCRSSLGARLRGGRRRERQRERRRERWLERRDEERQAAAPPREEEPQVCDLI